LGSATEPKDPELTLNVKGSDVQTGSPGSIDVTAEEVHMVVQPIVRKIAEAVRATLAELPPEVSADVFERGIVLTGGGALLEGMREYLQEETRLTVRIADEPRLAIVRGLSQMFDEPLLLRRVTRKESNPRLDTEITAF
jgi:rod shape-determining protein MreB and related proteins